MKPKQLLLDALERPPAERAAFLDAACAGDARLRARVDALLAAHDAADARLGPSTPPLAALVAGAPAAPSRLGPGVGDRVGDYELLELLGEGGFGSVYRARQERPVRREVALKLVKPGMDTRAVLTRFEAERQALALMDHPHIARVLEVGATDGGRPWVVMELVDGVPITRFVRERRLDLRARLRLFLLVVHALQHAHQKGVVHRDVKAGNVLVTEVDGEPVPKVIDFGIAKAVRGGALDAGLTAEGHLLGTPSTMSPEQLAGGPDVDTRADVYALGLLLYELLAGAPPFDHGDATLAEIRRVVREDLPERPSRLRAALRADGDPRATPFEVPADLDWIALRCLEKERERRYPTAWALAQDVERFLAHMPVEAAPPSTWYRARKALRRHRAAASAAGVLLLALLVAVVGLAQGKRLADREAAEARRQERLARSVLRFFTEDLLAAAVPSGQPGHGREVRVVDVLRLADARVGGSDLPDDPLVETALRRSLGGSWAALGQYDAARAQLAAALERLLVERGELDAGTVATRLALADVLRGLGELDAAERELAAVAAALDTAPPPSAQADRDARAERARLRAALARQRGLMLLERGAVPEALARLEALAADAHATPRDRLAALEELGLAQAMAGDHARAVESFARAHAERVARAGPRDPFSLATQLNHGNALRGLGRYDEARPILEQAVAGLREVLGPRHPDTLVGRHAHARLLLDTGALDAAEPALTELLADHEAVFGAEHTETLDVLAGLFLLHYARGEAQAAEQVARTAHERSTRVLGADHPRTWQRGNELAAALHAQGRYAEVAPLVEANLAGQASALGSDHPSTLQSLVNLALLRIGLEEHDAAEALLREALVRHAARAEPLPGDALSVQANLAGLLVVRGRFDEAERLAREGLERLQVAALQDVDLHAHLLQRHAEALAGLGRAAEAERQLRDAWALLEPGFGAAYPRSRDVAALLLELLEQRGAEAAELTTWRERAGGG